MKRDVLLIFQSSFLVFFLSIVSAAGAGVLETNSSVTIQVYTLDMPNTGFIIPQIFVVTKKEFKQSEDVVLSDFQDIFESCKSLIVDLNVRKATGQLIISHEQDIGSAGYMTAFVTYTISGSNTRNWDVGDYVAESNWKCDGMSLGKDGSFDDVSTVPSMFQFKIVSSSELIREPLLCQIDACNPGYAFENPGTTSCFCKAMFVVDDGSCDLGENDLNSPKDCGGNTLAKCSQQGLILIDDLCVDPNNACEQDGGNVECPSRGTFGFISDFFKSIFSSKDNIPSGDVETVTQCESKAKEQPLLGWIWFSSSEEVGIGPLGIGGLIGLTKTEITGQCKPSFLVYWILSGLGIILIVTAGIMMLKQKGRKR